MLAVAFKDVIWIINRFSEETRKSFKIIGMTFLYMLDSFFRDDNFVARNISCNNPIQIFIELADEMQRFSPRR